MVLLAEIPRSLFSLVHNSEVNCGPLSNVRSPGTPKQAIQCVSQETLDACLSTASCHENSSAHRLYKSTMVKRYVMDSDSGSRPTMSTWRDPKRWSAGYVVVEVHGHASVLWRIGRGDMFGTSWGHRSSFCARQTDAR